MFRCEMFTSMWAQICGICPRWWCQVWGWSQWPMTMSGCLLWGRCQCVHLPNIWGPSWDNRESFSMWSLWIQLRLVHGSCQKTVVYKIATCHPGFCNPCAMQWTVWIAQNCCTVREKGWKHWRWIGAWLPLLIITTPPPLPGLLPLINVC